MCAKSYASLPPFHQLYADACINYSAVPIPFIITAGPLDFSTEGQNNSLTAAAGVQKQLPRMKLGKCLNTEVFIWIGFSGLADEGR